MINDISQRKDSVMTKPQMRPDDYQFLNLTVLCQFQLTNESQLKTEKNIEPFLKIFLPMIFLETLQILHVELCKIWELDYHTVLSKSWDIQLPPTGHMRLPKLKSLWNIQTYI